MNNETGQPVKFLGTSVLVLFSFSALLRAAAAPSKINLPGPRAFPESSTSTSDGTIFVGNIAEGGILRVKNGQAEVWIKPGTFGIRSIFGVFADEKTGTLWHRPGPHRDPRTVW
jgi:hypothetical protein